MAEQQPTAERKRNQGRSPSYPGIGLETAIARARRLYEKEQRHSANVEVILDDWGYKPRSGAGMVTLAALKKFGLILDQGSGDNRKARLSDLALRILLEEENSPARGRLIQESALMPGIHKELWREYEGSLPSDGTIKKHLLLEKGFTESAVEEFIPQFKGTIAFAKLTPADKLSSDDKDKPDDPLSADPPAVKQPQGLEGHGEATSASTMKLSQPVREMSLPVGPNDYVMFRAAFPLSKQQWQRVRAWLELMESTMTESGEE